MTLIEPDGDFLPQGSHLEEEKVMINTFAPKFAAKFAVAAAAVCTVGAFAAPAAFAAPKSIEVSFKDLDLTSTNGQNALEGRIKAAARNVCRTGGPATGTLINSQVDWQCYKQAMTNVRAHVAAAIDKADDNRLGG
jgi:UrcA family protein